MGLEVLRRYSVLYNEGKESKNRSNICFFCHSLLPCSYLLGRPAVDVVSFLCLPGLVLHHQEAGKAELCTGPACLTLAADSTAACTFGLLGLLQPCSTHRCLQPKTSPHYCTEETNGFLPIRDLPKSPGESELPVQFPHPCPSTHPLSVCCFLPARQAK